MLKSINPATEEDIKFYTEMTEDEIISVLKKASDAQSKWKNTTFGERSSKMKRAAEVLRANSKKYAEIMTLEMGKPVSQSYAEVEKCAWVCEYYAENAEQFLSDEFVKTDASKSFVTFNPLGVVLAVMPWNFPFWQVFRFAAPALMAGNGGVLKHSSNVMGCAFAIEEVFNEAGFPEGLFGALIVSSNKIKYIIEHPLIAAVTLTGSVNAGKAVAAAAGGALKKTVLELGGSDAYVILEDADLENTAKICVTSRLINSGQSCIAAKRFIVVEKVYEEFERLFIEEMESRKMGNPMDESVIIGPQARTDLRDELHDQVLRSTESGAKIKTGGAVPMEKGAYYPATVLTGVKPGMPAFDEELFGPVAALIRASGEAEAFTLANKSVFGLGAAVFTRDKERGERAAKEYIEAGCCFVNDLVKSDPRLPFGGIKESGYGRELSHYGIKEFVNIKSVYVK